MASAQTPESMLGCRKAEQQEKKAKAACADEQSALKCPRCDSTNTKFCYYNNYSLSQPRYFCKSCRRYWTKGGTLRNVPVGGGCRRNKRSSSRPARTNQDPLLSSLTSSPIHPPLMPSLATLPYDRPIICNNNVNPACDVLESYGLLGGGGFLQTPATNGLFHSLCYGIGSDDQQSNSVEWNGGNGEIIMGNSSYHQDRICGSGGVKQEVCYGRDEGESRLNWGFPWLLQGGGEGANNSDVIISSSRQSWNENGFGPYSWHHGLINSPLM